MPIYIEDLQPSPKGARPQPIPIPRPGQYVKVVAAPRSATQASSPTTSMWLRAREVSGDLVTAGVAATPSPSRRYLKGDFLIFNLDKIVEVADRSGPKSNSGVP